MNALLSLVFGLISVLACIYVCVYERGWFEFYWMNSVKGNTSGISAKSVRVIGAFSCNMIKLLNWQKMLMELFGHSSNLTKFYTQLHKANAFKKYKQTIMVDIYFISISFFGEIYCSVLKKSRYSNNWSRYLMNFFMYLRNEYQFINKWSENKITVTIFLSLIFQVFS